MLWTSLPISRETSRARPAVLASAHDGMRVAEAPINSSVVKRPAVFRSRSARCNNSKFLLIRTSVMLFVSPSERRSPARLRPIGDIRAATKRKGQLGAREHRQDGYLEVPFDFSGSTERRIKVVHQEGHSHT